MNPPSERGFPLLPFAKADAGASPGAAAFLEDLIDACVMESRESMKYEGRMMKWGARFGAFSSFIIHPSTLRPAPEASAAQQRNFLAHLHQTLNAPSHPIRNRLIRLIRLIRLTADSPDLLAIIKQEGKV